MATKEEIQTLIKKIVQAGLENKKHTIPKLIKLLEYHDGNVQKASASALGRMEATEAEDSLLGLLEAPQKPQVKQYAINALGKLGTSKSLDVLKRIEKNRFEKGYNIDAAKNAVVLIKKRSEGSIQPATRHQSPVTSPGSTVHRSTATDLSLSPDQQKILEALYEWARDGKRQTITVGGYAGTGKTTLVGIFTQTLLKLRPKIKIAYACFTGKAAHVLYTKLVAQNVLRNKDYCGTIHALLYSPIINSKGQVTSWRKNETIEYDLIIIDEASMVPIDIWNDLLYFDIPTIALGDHGQLPPIESKFNLMENPELRLEKIHRQAEGNPILKLATLARETGIIPFQKLSESVQKVHGGTDESNEIIEKIAKYYSKESLILCARNKTRIRMNNHIRFLRGIESEYPTTSEPVICLKNNYDLPEGPIYNGMIGTIQSIKEDEKHWYNADILMHDSEQTFSGRISRYQFNQEKYLESIKGLHHTEIGDRFDFGYALTVHKAQGSQAKTVLLLEEYQPYLEEDERRRWLYTAITRAVEELYIIG